MLCWPNCHSAMMLAGSEGFQRMPRAKIVGAEGFSVGVVGELNSSRVDREIRRC